MLISSKHTGTGSFNKKKTNKKREIIILESICCFDFLFLVWVKSLVNTTSSKTAKCGGNSARWSPALSEWSQRCLFGKYWAATLASIQTANCDWWFRWSPRTDLLRSSLRKSCFGSHSCVEAAPGGRSISERLKQTPCLHSNNYCK